jgi:two-component system response regulator YesN
VKMETSSFNTPLFWQLFVKYLILILIPSIVASTFIYFYVVHMLEQEIRKSNHMVIKNFSDQTDAIFLSLQTDVINFLETSSLQSFLRVVDEPYHLQKRMEQAHLLMRQLSSIRENEFITNAYLFFPKYDLVLDSDTYTNKDYYFGISYPMVKKEKEELFAQFSKKKMMDFTQPFTFYVDQKDSANNLSFHSGLFVLTSYPFNRDKPDVYLVVNINQDKLNRSIHIDENWIASTAIVDQYGKRISQSGTLEIGEQKLADILVSNTIEPYFWNEHSEALSFVQSQFDDKWYYISLVDLQEMMRPAQTIKFFSMVFLVFFFVLGVGISYYLSRRLYIPILEIKTGLESYRPGD